VANAFYITNASALLGLDAIVDAIDTGTAPLLCIYDATGGVPADADVALGSQVLLAELAMNATAAFGAAADIAPGARATAAAITADSSANATGTAAFFRVLTQSGGTVRMQGTCGTSAADMILNTVAITALSTVSCSAFTVTLPEGP
jgi:hypothetical protein